MPDGQDPKIFGASSRPRRRIGRILAGMTNPATPRRHLPTSPFRRAPAPPPPKHFAVGDRVTHDEYGLGRAIGVEGDGEIAVLVDFGSRTERIPAPFSKLYLL